MQENFVLEAWERRKRALQPILEAAQKKGLLATGAMEGLTGFLLERGVDVGTPAAALMPSEQGLATPLSAEPATIEEDSEAPRFVRGFHDILISIGIMVFLSGALGLTQLAIVVLATIILAEVFVKRQRLALPAFVLTGWFCGAGGYLMTELSTLVAPQEEWQAVFVLASMAVALSGYYWRYRVPVAFAALVVGATGTFVSILSVGLSLLDGAQEPFANHPWRVSALLGIFALVVFAMALRLELSDRNRVTRRSDAAFWLHLAAAPALLYTMLTAIFPFGDAHGMFGETSVVQGVLAVGAVAILMLIGLLLDRRAFVTSGLISLGYALNVIITSTGFSFTGSGSDTIFFAILLAIGLLVLGLGIGWRWLRMVVISALPDRLTAYLPIIR